MTMAYEFQEFPKWVYPDGKEPFIVNSAEEQAAAIGGDDDADDQPRRRGRPPGSKNKLTEQTDDEAG